MSNVEDIIKLINATKCEEEPKKKFQSYILIYTNVAWVIVLLVVILCILLSVDLTNLESNRIIFYIANFATLLSIILSISSILFAYFTSRDTQTQYVAMGKALEEVRAINFQIMISNSGLVSQVNDIAEDVSVLNNKL